MGAPVAHRAAKASSLSMSFAEEVGAQRPLGFWDPLSLVQNADQDRFDKLRFTEIKVRRAPRRPPPGLAFARQIQKYGCPPVEPRPFVV